MGNLYTFFTAGIETVGMKSLNRRDFLSLAGLATIGATFGGRAHSQAAATPASFLQPPRLPTSSPEPGLVATELVARPAVVRVGGQSARLLTYNGASPGPVLRVREGDTLRLRFTNRLTEMTNLHLHGLHVSPEVDNPLRVLERNDSVTLEFSIPKGSSGTYWYHPHVHGMVARQLFGGMMGVIVVEGEADTTPELREAQEQLVVLRDLELLNGSPAPHTPMDWMNGKEGSILTVNGAIKPTLTAQKSMLRLRLLNASNARYYRLQLEQHPLHLIATDGGMIEKPVAIEELLLAPGERAEVLVQLEREGTFRLLNLPYQRGTMMGGMGGMHMGGMGMSNQSPQNPQTLLLVHVPKPVRPTPLPSRLASVPPLDDSRPAITRRLVFTEQMMQARFFINNRLFDANRVDFTGRLGALEVWEIENRADMDHPFHLHTYPFQILSRNNRPEPYRAWKDVVNLRKNDIVRIAVPFTDFIGKTVYHCHVVEHEDRGMMGVLEVKDPRN